jgi:transposase
MPRPLAVPVREAIFRRWQEAQSASEIAGALGVPVSTVYRLLRRFRRDGSDGIVPGYRNPAADLVPPDAVQAALALRREHPTWGAAMIRVHLLDEAPERPVPSERTLQRWFVRADLSPAPAGSRPKVDVERATSPHERRQMDAKEHIKLCNNRETSWVRMIDECSGAVLHTTVFPPRDLVEGRSRCSPRGTPPGVRALGPAPLPAGR